MVGVLSHWFQTQKSSAAARAADLGWRILEAGIDVDRAHNVRYEADRLAAELVKLDPERGFRLLDAALARAMRRSGSAGWYRTWSPLNRVGTRQPFWEQLRKIDRDRALKAVLDAMVTSSADGLAIFLSVGHLAQVPKDAEFLRGYAVQSEAHALAVAAMVTSRDDGFWPLACGIFEQYPDSDAVRSRLAAGIQRLELVGHGSYAQGQLAIAAEIERIRDSIAGLRARGWLDAMAEDLRAAAAQNGTSEQDRLIED
ncbi:MAG: hypothetical protein ACLQJR_08080 [Stellaceae bacterium]